MDYFKRAQQAGDENYELLCELRASGAPANMMLRAASDDAQANEILATAAGVRMTPMTTPNWRVLNRTSINGQAVSVALLKGTATKKQRKQMEQQGQEQDMISQLVTAVNTIGERLEALEKKE